ncbi:hypothetical protein [Wolbachia endosymbiont of Brugia malayi]|uniref:hypothetical protein n=1 Tax=Wolbachia endosymbiont of Brugia malayi TaxID=80849 RepID=UPI00059F3E54|nr:hypothetical protein [Wolbachia endosymbiont of Brugia malayi]
MERLASSNEKVFFKFGAVMGSGGAVVGRFIFPFGDYYLILLLAVLPFILKLFCFPHLLLIIYIFPELFTLF